ncbi:MerR family transcriptional regulator [Lichenihabitans psoromatis]|uniref:MerR family transcriptional regulator n=1 Tax=Lichenihabitans psoromatis TaxID=2528642 RepID=UPI0010384C6A|nr:MerR family transcriptional regulator [Lichenihabitans psoromatis]
MSLAKSPQRHRSARPRSEDVKIERISIGEMARAFDVSLRTLRFYEDRGLLVPRRDGTTRLYASSDKARLDMILQAKQLGFTLTEIRDMLAGAEPRPQTNRLHLKSEQIVAQIAHLERQRNEIDGAISVLRGAQADIDGRP